MILIVTNQRDITSDFIVLELQRRERPYFRLNTETLPLGLVTMAGADRDDWSISLDDRTVRGSDVTAAYLRRPGAPLIRPEISEPAEREYCQTEWNAFLKSLYARLEGRWLNSPAAIVMAEDKPRQLLLAAELGFNVPCGIITNDVAAVQPLVDIAPVIAKPLREPLLKGEIERVMFTTRLPEVRQADADAMAAAPLIVQHEVRKAADVRVTIVGRQLFAVAIHSQQMEGTEVDWRRGSCPDLPHEPVDLPLELASRCVELVSRLGLRYGAIDLIEDKAGQHWFLEINPNGQWAWIENRTRLPIAAAIVDELEAIGAP